jgi:pimeloyl-ACP methyl ester carboxylesterase
MQILFLHGWGVGHDAYMPLLERLSEKHTVFAPDLPGFGASPEPDRPWGAGDYADHVAAYCKEKGLTEPVCMGHSNGGRILLRLLSREDPGIKPPKMVLFGSAGLKPKRGLAYYLKVYTYKAGKLILTPFPKALERFRSGRGSADYRAASPVMKATMSRLLSADLTAGLCKIGIPTLLIWGSDDTAAPLSDGKIMERHIPDAGLVEIPGGHWSFMEQIPRIMAILDNFL